MTLAKIACVGVGRMGANIARRLKECGHLSTSVFDVQTARAGALAGELGAGTARTLAESTASAEVIFTVVTDDSAQLGLYGQVGDSLLIGAKGKRFINCATVTPRVHVEIEHRARAAGAEVIEAC